MTRRLRALCPLALLACACSSPKGPAIHLTVAHGASSDGLCVSAAAPASDELVPGGKIDVVRVSFKTHGTNDTKGTFVCDRLFKPPAEPPSIRVAAAGEKTIDIVAEAFKSDASVPGKFRRVATGALYGVDLKAKQIPTLRMFSTESFRCVDSRLARARAFHSATVLPSGQVLIVGGVVAGSDAASETIGKDTLYLTGGAEVYDAADGTFKAVTEKGGTPAPRAFHQAALLSSSGSVHQILLVGGATSTDPSLLAFGVTNSGVGGPRLVPFDTSQTVPVPLPTRAIGAELLTYDAAARTLSRAPVSDYAAAAFLAALPLPGGVAVAGGVDYGDPTDTTVPIKVKSVAVQQPSEMAPRFGNAVSGHLGATLSPLTDDVALLWGGGLVAADPPGELVIGLTAGKPLSTLAVMSAGALPTQFHTASVVETGTTVRILVTGGFVVDAGGNAQQPPPAHLAARILSAAGGTVTSAPAVFPPTDYVSDASTCTNAIRYRPAGWESAVPISRGRVLVTGGSPTFVRGGCNDCESGATPGLLCSLHQASIFELPSTLRKAGDTLQVGRFGHSSSLMPDGTVLLIGGISRPAGAQASRTVGDAEVFNPRGAVPPYDETAMLPAPVDADDPLAVELSGQSLHRAPGALAVSADKPTTPAKPCGDL